jgi:translation initiation factor 2B subunit (eIF-2B alpha/beta/delta family)
MDEARFEACLAELYADRSRGASALARRCLEWCGESARTAPARTVAELAAVLDRRAEALAAARPTMVAIANLVRAWRQTAGDDAAADLAPARAAAAAAAAILVRRSEDAVHAAAARAAARVGDGKTVLTHSRSGTVLETFAVLARGSVRAIVTESRPLYEGRVVAAELGRRGIATVSIVDAAAAALMPEVDAVLVGADAILPDDAIVNKVGTRLIALAAAERGVPFIVVCESFKRWPSDRPPPIEFEEKEAAEVAPPAAGVRIRNPYFEATPARLITALVTE